MGERQVSAHPCAPDVSGKIANTAIESGLRDCFLHVGTFGTVKYPDMVEDGAISHAIGFADRWTFRVQRLDEFPGMRGVTGPAETGTLVLCFRPVVVSDIEQRHRRMNQQVHALEVRLDHVPAGLDGF